MGNARKNGYIIEVTGGKARKYVRAVNYSQETAACTAVKQNAKRYQTFDMATADVDTLIIWAQEKGLSLTIR